MDRIVHEFTVVRWVQGSRTELELKASFDVMPENEIAELDGEIYLVDSGIPWDGRLTKREQERIATSAYDAWEEENGEPHHHSMRDDSCIIDSTFDDEFDDDMALKVASRGTVNW